jgi:hypothetical protein
MYFNNFFKGDAIMNPAVLKFLEGKPTLLLDILVHKDNNNIKKYFGKDENSGQIFVYDDIDLKIKSVIKRSIDLLCKGRFIEDDLLDDSLPESILADIHMKTGHYRTICLLLSLKWFFENKNDILKELNNDDIDLAQNNFYISMPLLLIQVVRFSQIEWDNNRFCYEYYSSKSAKSYLSSFFDKQDVIKNKQKIIILIIEQVIRWHTLMGQYLRGSSTFCIPNSTDDIYSLLIDKDPTIKDYLKNIPKLLSVFEVQDNIIRISNFKFVKKVSTIIRTNFREKKKVNYDSIIKELKDQECNNIDKLCDLVIKESHLVTKDDILYRFAPKKTIEDVKEKFIFSYLRPSEGYTRQKNETAEYLNSYNMEKIKTIKKEIEKKVKEKISINENEVYHIVINRRQRNMGFVRKLIDKPGNIPEKIFLVEKEKDASINLIHVFFHPIDVAKGLNLISGNDLPLDKIDNPITFLKESFENAVNLTMPIVKRLTDLLEFYYFQPNKTSCNKTSCFRLTILIDDYHQIKIWLPKIKNCKELDIQIKNKKNVTIKDILFRFINYTVSNYGMTLEYKNVDFSFTEKEEFWLECLRPTYREKLGLHVFDGYLLDCCSEVISITRSKKEFVESLDKKLLTDMYDKNFQKNNDLKSLVKKLLTDINFQINNELINKYILGIDIGGSNIKIQLFQISDKGKYQLTSSYYLSDNLSFYTFKTEKTEKTEKKEKHVYENADEFASYIIEQVSKYMDNIKDSEGKQIEILDDSIISIGCCWPGPVKKNKIVSTSGLLAKFKGYSGKILDNRRRQIVELDIAGALQKKWQEKTGNKLSVSLYNDGDVESAGLVFAKTHLSGNNKEYKSLFNETVAIVKLGTGTAGSIISLGQIVGLNEYGKYIIELDHDNTENEDKRRDNRFPDANINKQLSMKAFKNMMKELGADDAAANDDDDNDAEGRDIDFLLKISKSNSYTKEFGVIELVSRLAPELNWGDILEKDKIVKNKVIKKIGSSWSIESGKTIDDYTMYHLSKMFSPIYFDQTKRTLSDVLESLGKRRLARLNLEQITADDIIEGIKGIGSNLADLVAAINDTLPSHMKPLKAVVAAGGIMQSADVKKHFVKGFKENVKKYLFDNIYEEKDLVKEFDTKKDIEKNKFYYICDGEDYARLGSAILGFDHYITNEKIKELISIKENSLGYKYKNSGYDKDCKFLKVTEASKYLLKNAGRLKITVNNDKTVETI